MPLPTDVFQTRPADFTPYYNQNSNYQGIIINDMAYNGDIPFTAQSSANATLGQFPKSVGWWFTVQTGGFLEYVWSLSATMQFFRNGFLILTLPLFLAENTVPGYANWSVPLVSNPLVMSTSLKLTTPFDDAGAITPYMNFYAPDGDPRMDQGDGLALIKPVPINFDFDLVRVGITGLARVSAPDPADGYVVGDAYGYVVPFVGVLAI